jgi:hypothetical protein
MKQLLVYTIDLVKLEGKGDFLCPCCGAMISPDDETENIYSVLEAKVRNDKLENLLIQCINCSNKILITGFSVFGILNGSEQSLNSRR